MAELVQPPPGARLVKEPADIREAWDRLAAALQVHVDRGPCVLVGVLLGGMFPLVEIASRLRGDFEIDCCRLSRYGGGTTGGELRWLQAPRADLAGRTALIVDDIYDEGKTLAELHAWCLGAGAADVRIAVLAHKRHGRPVAAVRPDYVGVEVGDEYVFGCGMDLDGRWRHLDSLYTLDHGVPGA
ncbi:MAG: hypoxanthine-guanine phosphoribosyltransferase [Gammaproteobacteria bacterium]|nr:hypoxanthine-guanine phosphoribosyltransferase [Gammaproteobacteria bacterium]